MVLSKLTSNLVAPRYLADITRTCLNRRKIPYKSFSASLTVSDLASIRLSATAIFSRTDVDPVRWAGVFGSFAAKKQTNESDIDIVVVHDFDYVNNALPLYTNLLEDILPEIWGRKVDVVHLTLGRDFRGYVSIESLLSSIPIYGSNNDHEILQLQRQAEDILNSGSKLFERIRHDILETQMMVSKISFEVC